MAYKSFLQQPLISLLQQSATSKIAKHILIEYSQHLLTIYHHPIRHLRIPNSIAKHPPNNTECSLQTAINYWRKKEKK